MTIELLLWSIPLLILLVALLGVRRYSPFNIARHAGGLAIVLGTLAVSASIVVEPFVLILLGAIGGTLVGQAHEAEKQRAARRRDDVMAVAPQG